jgi:transposase-like protein
MASLKEFEKLTAKERLHRYFSDDFKRKKVSEIDRNLTTITEVCREYQVSNQSVYKWIYKFSRMRKKSERQIVESKSDTKKILALKEKIKELERLVGQKQIQIDFLDKLIDLAEENTGVEIKKKGSSRPCDGSGPTKKSTPTK